VLQCILIGSFLYKHNTEEYVTQSGPKRGYRGREFRTSVKSCLVVDYFVNERPPAPIAGEKEILKTPSVLRLELHKTPHSACGGIRGCVKEMNFVSCG
jgi:hypothetical protein